MCPTPSRFDDRAARVARFQSDRHCPLFLISLKAGGTGAGLFAVAAFLGLLAVIMLSVALAYFVSMTGLHLAWSDAFELRREQTLQARDRIASAIVACVAAEVELAVTQTAGHLAPVTVVVPTWKT